MIEIVYQVVYLVIEIVYQLIEIVYQVIEIACQVIETVYQVIEIACLVIVIAIPMNLNDIQKIVTVGVILIVLAVIVIPPTGTDIHFPIEIDPMVIVIQNAQVQAVIPTMSNYHPKIVMLTVILKEIDLVTVIRALIDIYQEIVIHPCAVQSGDVIQPSKTIHCNPIYHTLGLSHQTMIPPIALICQAIVIQKTAMPVVILPVILQCENL